MTTWFVATNGSDGNSGTSAASPFLTIQHAASVAQPGDTVSVASGDYQGSFTITCSGISGQPITFISSTQYGARIVVPANNAARQWAWTVGSSGTDGSIGAYVVIDGFHVDGTTFTTGTQWQGGFNCTGNGTVVRRCKIHDITTADTNGGAGILLDGWYGGHGLTAERNVVANIGWTAPATGSLVHGIYLSTIATAQNNLVLKNDITSWHGANNLKIINNTVVGDGTSSSNAGILIGSGDISDSNAGGGHYDTGGNTGSRVFNNIVYRAVVYGIEEEQDTSTGGSIGTNYYSNNLFFQSGTADYLLLGANSAAGTIDGDPIFLNNTAAISGSYQLQPGSPGIGDGIASLNGVSAPATDIAGDPRPSNGAYDIGAYQAADAANQTDSSVTAPLIQAPLTGTVTTGTWQSSDLSGGPTLPSGQQMHFDYLLPSGYSTANSYPVLVHMHENDEGNDWYNFNRRFQYLPGDSGADVWYNNVAWRTAYPCIIILPYCDQTGDTGGATENFGGWSSPGDHGPNEDSVAQIAQLFINGATINGTTMSVYPNKVYCTGDSLGGIGTWAQMLDYNAYNGSFGKIWAAGMPFAGVIERNTPPNTDQINALHDVPVFAVSGAGDTTSNVADWNDPLWRDYVGNSNYPAYAGSSSGVTSYKAGASQYYYLRDPNLGHNVWDTYRPLPNGKPMYDWLFSQSSTVGPTQGVTPQSVIDLFNSIAGTKTISCQFIECDDGRAQSFAAVQGIHDSTGKWLGGIGIDYYHYNVPGDAVLTATQRAIDYWNAGGLIILSTHMPNPTTGGGVADTSNLDASGILTSGTATYNAFVAMLDQIADGIQQLKDAGVVVIYRPFHENDGNWFWWGTGLFLTTTQFKSLWRFTYNYLKSTKGLDNIVWAFTGVADLTNYPGDDVVDVTGNDEYSDTPADGQSRYLIYTQGAPTKPFMLAEFGFNTAGMDETLLTNAIDSVMPKTVMWQQWWSGGDNAGMDLATNVAAALSDPRVLNRGDFSLTTTSTSPAVRDYWDLPGGQNSAWCTPFGDGATWGADTDPDTIDLRNGGIINTTDNFGVTIYVGSASDSTYEFSGPGNTTLQTGYPGATTDGTVDVTVHLPTGAQSPGHPGSTQDGGICFFDPVSHPNMIYTFGQANIDSPGVQPGQGPFTAGQGEFDDATSDLFAEDQESGNYGFNVGAGVIRAYDLDPNRNPNYPKIQHATRYSTDAKFLKRNDADGNNGPLGTNSWPQKYQDFQSGINVYTGNLLAGTTVGIPITETMPAGLTQGGQMLWWNLQHYPSFWRDQASGGFHLNADQEAWDQFPDILNGMNTDLPTIVQHLRPLRNQHIGGQSFSISPKNGPGNRVDTGPVPLRGTTTVTPPTEATATVNIFPGGLPAWQPNVSYVLGQRVSNAGLAWECALPGRSGSSSGPATKDVTNLLDGGAHWKFLASIDYTSISAAVSALPTTDWTQDIVWHIWNTRPITTTAATPFMVLSGHPMGIHSLTIAAAPGESIRDSLAGKDIPLRSDSNLGVTFLLPLGATGAAINYINIDDPHVIFDGIQFIDPEPNSVSTIVFQNVDCASLILRNCIIDGTSQADGAALLQFGLGAAQNQTSAAVMANCLIVDHQSSGYPAVNLSGTSLTFKAANCTFVAVNSPANSLTFTAANSFALGDVINCAIFGYSSASDGGFSFEHSCTDQASWGSGSDAGNNLFSKSAANQFISTTTDFRLLGKSDCIDKGRLDSSDVVDSADIAHARRPQGKDWCIGCWERLGFGPHDIRPPPIQIWRTF